MPPCVRTSREGMALDDSLLAQLKRIYPNEVAPIDWSGPSGCDHYSDCALFDGEECSCKPATEASPDI